MKKLFFGGQILGIVFSTAVCFTSFWPMGVFFLTCWAGLGIAWMTISMGKEVWS